MLCFAMQLLSQCCAVKSVLHCSVKCVEECCNAVCSCAVLKCVAMQGVVVLQCSVEVCCRVLQCSVLKNVAMQCVSINCCFVSAATKGDGISAGFQ